MKSSNYILIYFRYFKGNSKSPDLSIDYDDSMLSDYESGSPPSRDENSMSFPCLQQKININFKNLKLEPVTTRHRSFDFGSHYRQLYLNHEREPISRHRNSSDIAKWIVNQATLNLKEQKSPSLEKLPSELNSDRTSSKLVLNSVCNGDSDSKIPPIWCMDYMDNLIVLGCANGRLEFWEGTTGTFKVRM